MQAAFDYAVEYIHDRKQFGQPVGTFQLMQGICLHHYTRVIDLSFAQVKLQTCIQVSVQVDLWFMPLQERATMAKSADE